MNEELKVIITAQVSKLKEQVAIAKKAIDDFTKDSEKGASKMDEAFKAAGTNINNALKGVGVAIAGAATALLGMSAATEEYRANQAKLKSAFESAGGSAETATKTYNDLYRVLGDDGQTTEAANHLAKLTTNQTELSEWTNICQGVYATFGDSLPIESLTEAANETAKTGALTGALADALNWAGIKEDDFQAKLDACNTEAEREQLIRSTLNTTYSEAATAYETNAAAVLAQNEAQASLTASMASLGETMAPVLTVFTQFASDALAVISPYLEDFTTNLLPVLQTLLDGLITALETALSWISQHQTALGVIAAVIGTIVTAIGLYNTVAAVKAAMDAAQVTTLWGLVSAYAAQAAAMLAAIAPYVLIAAAIAAVIAIIIYWDEILEWIKNAWKVATEWISEKVSTMVEGVKKWFGDMKENVVNKVNEIKEGITQKFNEVKENVANATEAAAQTAASSLMNMKSAYERNGGGIKGIAAATMEGVKGAFNTGYTFLNTLTGGKLDSIKNTISTKLTAAKTVVTTVLDAIKQGFQDKLDKAREVVSGAIEKIKGFFNFKWELPKLKLPSFSITGKFSLNPLQVPKFGISWNKLGGVFDKPTLFNYGGSLQGIGEDGAEAVVPLENNLGWLDKLANMLAERQGNTPIILQIDGKTFAQTSIDSINQLTRQSGKLSLNLV